MARMEWSTATSDAWWEASKWRDGRPGREQKDGQLSLLREPGLQSRTQMYARSSLDARECV